MNPLRKLMLSKSSENTAGTCVIYVMSRDQRVQDNHALLEAQQQALAAKLPLLVVFNMYSKSGDRSQEQFRFMLDGLQQIEGALKKYNIPFSIVTHDTAQSFVEHINLLGPSELIFDFNPLKGPRAFQKKVATYLTCNVSVVDTHNIIPAWVASDKEEFAAHTFRSKVHKLLDTWLVEPEQIQKHPHTYSTQIKNDWDKLRAIVNTVAEAGQKLEFTSGETSAHDALANFIETRLAGYAAERNIPTHDGQSNLSPYLHFGQLSSLRIALTVIERMNEAPLLFRSAKLASYEGEPTLEDSINAFLEELIVRKELADNFCFYSKNYHSFEGARQWAQDTLNEQRSDPRDFLYSLKQWESAQTHDEVWNAAQNEMKQTGKMHGYMRMYWAKKILEWSSSPEEAIDTACYLNDKYSIDGGDPNGYTGIMWSIVGIHDRPWFGRPVYGKIRYMNRGGLSRRFDVEAYIKRWNG